MCKNMTLDITFLVDVSTKEVKEMTAEKQFVKKVVENTGLSENGVHVSVVTFGKSAAVEVKLGETFKTKEFEKKVNEIRRDTSPATRFDKALEVVKQKVFTGKKDRKEATNLVILVTDGKQTKAPGAKRPSDIADELREEGVMMITVGVGEDISKPELDDITGNPSNVFHLENHEELVKEDVLNTISTKICEKRK